jgi:hypothetical protein
VQFVGRRSDGACRLQGSEFAGAGGSLPGEKWLRHWADNSQPSGAHPYLHTDTCFRGVMPD